MSSSRHSKTSAYQVYSSQSRKSSSRHSRSLESEDSREGSSKKSSSDRKEKSRDKKHRREALVDSDDEVLKISQPKSLLSLSLPSGREEQRATKSRSSRHRSSGSREDKKHASQTQSLMDMDFGRDQRGAGRKRNVSDSSDDDSVDESKSHGAELQKSKLYSDSDDEDGDSHHRSEKVDKDKRSWKESSVRENPIKLSPLVVEMPRKDLNGGEKGTSPDANTKPLSLLGEYVPPPPKKPVSLLDLAGGADSFDRGRQNYSRRSDGKSSHLSQNSDYHQGERRRESSQKKRRDGSGDEREVPSKKMKMKTTEMMKARGNPPALSNRITACGDNKQSFIVIPSTCPVTGIHGRASITVLMGSVTILGYPLQPGRPYPVFSPVTGGLLSLFASGDKLKAQDVKEEITKQGFSDQEQSLDSIGSNTIAVLLVKKLDSVLCDYVTTFIPYTQLFNPVPQREEYQSMPRGVTLPKVGLKVAPHGEFVSSCLNMSSEHQDVLDRWRKLVSQQEGDQPPGVVCCGAKNSGKSTFTRMLINASLQSVKSVAYLECDIGQTEFSPPATVSLHIISEPVLGAPFCHQRHAESMVFFGDVSPSTDPSVYVQCLTHVYKAYTDLAQPLPLIVNTMGFTEGLGLMLLIDTVNITKPDVVVQIESYSQAANLPALTHEMVALDPGWTVNQSPAEDPKKKMEETHKHELLLLMTLANQHRGFNVKLKPVDLRNLSLLSSLSLGLERSVQLNSVPPYCVPYAQLAVHVCHHSVPSSELLMALDASVVALCVADISQLTKEREEMPYTFKEMPVCECLGLGIVRGVDTDKGLLYVVTTLPAVTLRKVNTVLKGSLTLPDQLILKQKGTGSLPYVDALAPSTAVSSLRPRSRMPRNNRRNN
ncbi:polynucleotide 5'-hydroxyl-kinase NOL9 [Aplysia californica]|uniref:Polynucleotide 5'-hydroxyl-kinase NOL9 n=1 Tax=Aplysia californica TaxID=6500 RepID=A0ABM1A4L3_APLCA|nr:polynucleotide 5'-hydroxyl-kinase NOL9 [Aplysia californica]